MSTVFFTVQTLVVFKNKRTQNLCDTNLTVMKHSFNNIILSLYLNFILLYQNYNQINCKN